MSPTLEETCNRAAGSTVRCAHCGLEAQVSGRDTWALQKQVAGEPTEGPPKYFCCHGCMGAYSLIHQLGLENFYSLRTLLDQDSQPVRKTKASDSLKNLQESGVDVQTLSDGTCRVRLGVEGLHCAACSWLIESLPPSVPGLKSARVRLSDRSLELLYDPLQTEPFRVAEYLTKFGYVLGPMHQEELEDRADRRLRQEHWYWIAIAFFLAANAMWIAISLYAGEATGIAREHERFLRWVGAILGLLSAAFPGRIFFRSAWQSIKTRIPHVDVPVATGLLVGTIGSLIGAATGKGHVYFDSMASLVLLLRIGRYIQFRAQYRSGMSIAKLMRFHDIEAVRISSDGHKATVPARQLRPGDRVEVRSGSMIPTDGVISKGQTELQTAFITGESRPQKAMQGQEVFGGSLNLKSTIEITVQKSAHEGRLGQISSLVQQATSDRTPLIQLADRVGRVFVWVVLALAIGTYGAWWAIQGPSVAIQRTVSLLTIACPCALALAAPLVITVAIGRAAREKIWIRDGNALERLSKPGLICFDKTGTLTFGELRVVDWIGPAELLPSVEAIESQSEHPISKALVEFIRLEKAHAKQQDPACLLKADSLELEVGHGIRGIVDGRRFFIGRIDNQSQPQTQRQEQDRTDEVFRKVGVFVDGNLQGVFRLGDVQRPGVAKTLSALQQRGWKLAILSGDDSPQVQSLGLELQKSGIGLEECLGGLSPEQKKDYLDRFHALGLTTVMIGDGINDAIALASADVGIAVRGPSEIALRNAPIYMGANHLELIPRLLDASTNAVKAIHRCFAASLFYNCITIGLAATGYIHPWIAAVFMPISGITVLLMAWTARTFPPHSKSLVQRTFE